MKPAITLQPWSAGVRGGRVHGRRDRSQQLGAARHRGRAPADRPRMLISAVEHVSVSRTASLLAAKGLAAVDVAPVTAGGFVDLQVLDALLDTDVALVSVMAASSETGVMNPVTHPS